MASVKFEVEKFNGENDFGLWRVKMKAILVHQQIWSAIEKKAPSEKETDETKAKREEKEREIEERAHSSLLMTLSDDVLREVIEEKTAFGGWEKLRTLYLRKSLASRLYLKKRLFTEDGGGQGGKEALERYKQSFS